MTRFPTEMMTQTPFFIDDLLAAMQIFVIQYLNNQTDCDAVPSLSMKSSFDRRFMSEIYRILGVRIDHSMESQPDQLFRTLLVQRVLSIQAAFGYSGLGEQRSLTGNVAWATLNIRCISLSIAWACQKSKPHTENGLKHPGMNLFVELVPGFSLL